MSTMYMPRVLTLLGLVVVTFGIFTASVAADETVVSAALMALALGSISVGAVVLVIGVQSAAAQRTQARSSSSTVREPQRLSRIVIGSFRRAAVIVVLLGILIVLLWGDQLARALAPLLGPGFVAAWLVGIALSWLLGRKREFLLRK